MPAPTPPFPNPPDIAPHLSYLEGLPYRERRTAIKRRVHPQYPRFFYKFRALDPNDARSIAKLRTLLVESRLWMSHHESFNDPFDMKAQVVLEGTARQMEDRFKALIADRSGARRQERREMLRNIMSRSRADIEATLQTTFRESAGAAGICSFAGDPRSILMWTHYAQNHEGVCLQFEFAGDPRTFAWAQEVKYAAEYPRINYVDTSTFGDQLYTVLTRKHSGWSYEKEWRIVHLAGANTLLPFRAESLSGLIMGCRATDQHRSAVKALLAERINAKLPQVRLYRAEQHPSAYELIIKRWT